METGKWKQKLRKILSGSLTAAMVLTLLPSQMIYADTARGRMNENAAALQVEDSSASARAGLPEKLVHFDFDQAAVDESIAGDNGVVGTVVGSGALISTTDKIAGSGALNLRNYSYLSVTKNGKGNLLAGKEAVTISYYSKPGNTNAGWVFYIAPDANEPVYQKESYLGVLDKTNSIATERYLNGRTNGSVEITAEEGKKTPGWHRVDLVYDTDKTVIYIDGIEVKRDENVKNRLSDVVGTDGIFYLGKATWGNGEYYTGMIDEFTVYDGALTAEQIAAESSAMSGSIVRNTFDSSQSILGRNHGFSRIRTDLSLPDHVEGIEDSEIVWKSSNPSIISHKGEVMDAAGNGDNAVMTAEVSVAEGNSRKILYTWEYPVRIARAVSMEEPEITYHFDDESTISGAAVSGEVWKLSDYAGEAMYRGGRSGAAGDKALYLDGSYGIELPHYNFDVEKSGWTVSLWYNPQGMIDSSSPVVFIGYGDGTVEKWVGAAGDRSDYTNGFQAWWNDTTSNKNQKAGWIQPGIDKISFEPGEWNMLTLTQTAAANGTSKVSVYVNGDLYASMPYKKSFLEGEDQTIYLGVNYWDKPFYGLMDDVTIYREALTASEIKADYLRNATDNKRQIWLESVVSQSGDGELDQIVRDIPTGVDDIALTWTSDNTDVIDHTGRLVAQKGGQANLTAKAAYNGETLFEDITVHVRAATSVTVKHVDETGNPIGEDRVINGLKMGDSYTHMFSREENPIPAGSDVYIPYEAHESYQLTVDALAEENAITVPYRKVTVASVVNPADISAIEGNKPVFPERLQAKTTAGEDISVNAVWDDQKLKIGENTVSGTVTGTDTKPVIKVTIYACDEIVADQESSVSSGDDTVKVDLGRAYTGTFITEYDLSAVSPGTNPYNGAVMYNDENGANSWNGAAMLHFTGKGDHENYFRVRYGDGKGTASSYPVSAEKADLLYDSRHIYHVRTEINTAEAGGTYRVFVTDKETGAEVEISDPNSAPKFRMYQDGIIRDFSLGGGKYRVSNHKISWQSGYAVKEIRYVVDGAAAPDTTESFKELPGIYTFEPEDTYKAKDGRTYYLDAEASGWNEKDNEAAAGETVVYEAHYRTARITGAAEEVKVETREKIAPELPKRVNAEYDQGFMHKASVTWEAVDPSLYAAASEKTFQVTGIFDETKDDAQPVTVTATVAVKTLADYKIADFTFDEEAGGTWADSVNPARKAEKENTVHVVNGVSGKAISLPGGDAGKGGVVKLPEDLLIKDGAVQDDFTVSMFVRLPDVQQQTTAVLLHGDVLHKVWNDFDDAENKRNHISIYNRDSDRANEDGLFVEYSSKSGKTVTLGERNVPQTEEGKWAHVAVVTKGSTGEAWLYKNGVEAARISGITVKASDLPGRLNYLGSTDWPDRDYAGAFDEFRVYNTTLRPQEIKEICDSAFAAAADTNLAAAAGVLDADKHPYIEGPEGKERIYLATELNDCSITWKSADDSYIKISRDGSYAVVTRGEADEKVTLTATITYDTVAEKTQTKEFTIRVPASGTATDTDLARARVAAAKAALKTPIIGTDDTIELQTEDTENRCQITWSVLEGAAVTLAADGRTAAVNRELRDTEVILAATVTDQALKGIFDTRTFKLTITARKETAADRVAAAKEALTAPVIQDDSVTRITLETTGEKDCTITWASDHEAVRVTSDGAAAVITGGDTDVEVTLTAVITDSIDKSVTAEKAFKVIVPKKGVRWEFFDKSQEEQFSYTESSLMRVILGSNPDLQRVSDDLTLLSSVSYNGQKVADVAWTSSDTEVISTEQTGLGRVLYTGTVSMDVMLTAVITYIDSTEGAEHIDELAVPIKVAGQIVAAPVDMGSSTSKSGENPKGKTDSTIDIGTAVALEEEDGTQNTEGSEYYAPRIEGVSITGAGGYPVAANRIGYLVFDMADILGMDDAAQVENFNVDTLEYATLKMMIQSVNGNIENRSVKLGLYPVNPAKIDTITNTDPGSFPAAEDRYDTDHVTWSKEWITRAADGSYLTFDLKDIIKTAILNKQTKIAFRLQVPLAMISIMGGGSSFQPTLSVQLRKELSAEEKAELDAEELNGIIPFRMDESSVLTLPTVVGEFSSDVTWSSDQESVIHLEKDTGNNVYRTAVTRPADADAEVTLTAKIQNGSGQEVIRKFRTTVEKFMDMDELDQKLIADFSFDDSETGLAGKGAAAVLNGTDSRYEDGIFGGALYLGAQSWLDVTKAAGQDDSAADSKEPGALLAGKDEITVSYYSKSDFNTMNGGSWTFFAARSANDITGFSNGYYMAVLDEKTAVRADRFNALDGHRLEQTGLLNEWRKVDLVIGADRTVLYIDGVRMQEAAENVQSLSAILGKTGGVLYIGKGTWPNAQNYTGLLDAYKIYDRALTEDEVGRLYARDQQILEADTKLAAAYEALRRPEIGEDDIIRFVTEDTANECTIQWSVEENDLITIAEDGQTASVTHGPEEAAVKLTAVLTYDKGGVKKTADREFTIYVTAARTEKELAKERVEEAKAALQAPVIEGDKITFITSAPNGCTIAWSSDHEAVRIDEDGQTAAIVRGDVDTEVTLTAVITDGTDKTVTDTSSFQITVPKKEPSAETDKELETAKADLGTAAEEAEAKLKGNKADYPADRWEALEAAVAAAKEAAESGDAQAVAKAKAALEAAVSGFKTKAQIQQEEAQKREEAEKAEARTELTAVINTEKPSGTAADYTAESWAAYQKALADAQAVLNNPNAALSQITAAQTALVLAAAELEEIEPDPDKEEPDEPEPVVKKVRKITFASKTYQIAAGKKLDLSKEITITPKDATNRKMIYSLDKKSKSKKYASINNRGVVTLNGKGAGKTVTVVVKSADGGASRTVKIKIMKQAITKISFTKKTVKVKAGKSVKLTVRVTPKKNINSSLAWKSSNTKYATVKNGKVKTKKAGKGKTVTITVTATDGSRKKAAIKVKIVK